MPADSLSPLVYVSYAWRSRAPAGQQAELSPADDREAIVDELCRVLDQEDQIVVGRDKKLVNTGDLIKDFAGEIVRGGLILAVISHKSLRSDWCMVQELLQAFRRRNFDSEEFGSDVLALVLDDALNDLRNPLELIKHWVARLEQEQELMQLADPDRRGSPESWKGVDQLAELRGKLPDLLRALRIRAMPRGAEAMREKGFQAIRALVLQRLAEKDILGKRQVSTPGNNKSSERRHVFISYTRVDRKWVDRLKQMMAPILKARGLELRLWDDSQILPGTKWWDAIESALAESKVALLLVRDAFLASEFVMGEEVPKLLAAAEAEGVRVLWVSLSPCLVEHTPIGEYQAVLPLDQYLEGLTRPQQQRALRTIIDCILESLNILKPNTFESKYLERRHVFISYTRVDREWVDRLQRMMKPLLHGGGQQIELWDDSQIIPGTKWQSAIETALAEAKVALLLVSANYLASEFVMNKEVPKLLAAAEEDGLRLLWVCLSPCLVNLSPIWDYQALLPPSPTLAEMAEHERQAALLSIAESIHAALLSPAPEPDDDAPLSPERMIHWRIRCQIWREPLAEAVDLPMAWIPSDMAKTGGEFLLGVEPVSLRQWQVVAGWPQQDESLTPDTAGPADLDQPVTGISQEQALEFCRRLAVHSGRYYELPSEEQWEHACRAGSASPFSWGEVWSGHLARTTANPWGLRQLHGSVWQWCRGGALRGGSWMDPVERRQASSRATASDPPPPLVVGLRVCCLPFGTPHYQLEASKRQWRPLITRSACEQVLNRALSEAEFLQLEQALQRFRILGIFELRLFLSWVALQLDGEHDDSHNELPMRGDPPASSRQLPMAGNDLFTTAAMGWQELGSTQLAGQSKTPEEFWIKLGQVNTDDTEKFLQAAARAALAFPEPR